MCCVMHLYKKIWRNPLKMFLEKFNILDLLNEKMSLKGRLSTHHDLASL